MKHFNLPKDGGLIESSIPKDILHGFEKVYTEVFEDPYVASEQLSEAVIKAINDFRKKNPGTLFRLGLSTGATPISLYRQLTSKYLEGRVSFADVAVYSIDEYYPTSKDEMQSRNFKLHQTLLDKVDIRKENIHMLDGTVAQEDLVRYCAEYDASARDLDLLVIGLGEKGQVGFNEIGSRPTTRTRAVLLPYATRKLQAHNFNGDLSATPKQALTMGLDTILSAKKVFLMAWGEAKADAVKAVVEGHMGSSCPASFFQMHKNVVLYTDETAGSLLVRVVAPWKIGPCDWTPKFVRKAVIWLCSQVGKPILKLSFKDYLENSLGELLELRGPYDKINIQVFNDLQHTITGWPGGKPGCDEATRPVGSSPYPKTVLIFSPHPDDDVISMGGTFIRLAHQGHNVHVAYETSGDLAVHDDVVLQHYDAIAQLGFEDKTAEVVELIASKKAGEPEPKALLAMKAAIRRSEARGADRSFGLPMENVHFLNLPFYESGGVAKLPRTQADVDIIKSLMSELQPDQIYMAGDLKDPHGTHRVCTEAAMEALEQLREEGAAWVEKCNVWLYRGAWMEWELDRVDMAVPLSPDEVVEKRHAIYRHLSQKDIVPFPGDDPREFWQRAEERTQNTAKSYNDLGMAEYQAMEVFLKLF